MLPARPHLSAKDRLRLFDLHGGVCHVCSTPIDRVHQRWEIDHVLSRGMIGAAADTDENMHPAHAACHKDKTAKDAGALAKAERIRAKHFGAYRPKQTFPGSRASSLKKGINGRTERRDVEVRP